MMKEVYEKLLENLANINPEEKKKEWKKLKKTFYRRNIKK